jgi:UDP-glucose 4-epimerase
MAALIKLAQLRLPLPLGGLGGRRSLLSVDNLVEAIDVVLRAPAPLKRPLIVADPEPLTLPEMIAALRTGLGRKPGLVPVPGWLLGQAFRLLGRGEMYDRLAGSLVADAASLEALGWRPPVPTVAGLAALAHDAAQARPSQ